MSRIMKAKLAKEGKKNMCRRSVMENGMNYISYR